MKSWIHITCKIITDRHLHHMTPQDINSTAFTHLPQFIVWHHMTHYIRHAYTARTTQFHMTSHDPLHTACLHCMYHTISHDITWPTTYRHAYTAPHNITWHIVPSNRKNRKYRTDSKQWDCPSSCLFHHWGWPCSLASYYTFLSSSVE